MTRHPFSFAGDKRQRPIPEGQEITWHQDLLDYVGGDPQRCEQLEAHTRKLAEPFGLHLDFNVGTNLQPVDSQRVVLWARQFGKSEAYVSALARKHFEKRMSASHRSTVLSAAEEAGLDAKAVLAFLETKELEADVWRSYGSTVREKGIHAIPYMVFNSPLTDGGPFRSGKGRPVITKGSGDEYQFLQIFERMFSEVDQAGLLQSSAA